MIVMMVILMVMVMAVMIMVIMEMIMVLHKVDMQRKQAKHHAASFWGLVLVLVYVGAPEAYRHLGKG
jgi:hypothetical protein